MKKIFSIIIPTVLITILTTACSSIQKGGENTSTEPSLSYSSISPYSSPESDSLLLSDETIYEADIETIKNNYNSEDIPVYDVKIIDLNFDGKDELLVLTGRANPKIFEVWKKSDGKMNLEYSFGAGKVDFIDKISLKKVEINDESVYLFSFSYDGDNNMKADEVLSVIRKTEDGYEVEHLLSRGTITYPDIAEPFTKEFYRKGWSKYDIGWEQDFADITKEEYNSLYEEYTGGET